MIKTPDILSAQAGRRRKGGADVFNLRMTSGWFGSCVAHLRRIEGPVIMARPRHDQVDVLGAGTFQRDGAPTA